MNAAEHVLPRLVIAAPGSGHGKTTVASGLMAALRGEGLDVAGFKIGPDYIDPGYHALATGRLGRNLDPHLCGDERLIPLLLHGSRTPTPADVAVVEGVMGLFDGQIGGEGFASTAHVAQVIDAPVVIVIDIAHVSRTAAALVHGLITFDPGVRVRGVILNKAGSPRHAREVEQALAATGVDVLGVLPRNAGIEAPSRHLGLVPAAERDEAADALRRLADHICEHVDLQAVLAVAHSATPLRGVPWRATDHVRPVDSAERPRIAIAAGRAFTFRYAETDELIRAAGCDPVTFDPLSDTALPDRVSGLYLGGGFPEVHAADLSANTSLLADLRARIDAGLPTVAECAGLLYLCRRVEGRTMIGAVAADAAMTPKLTLGYRTAVADTDQVLAVAGQRVTGHEFHRTAVPDSAEVPAWLLDGVPHGFALDPADTGRPTVHASYLHVHWAGYPQLAQRFCDAAAAYEPGAPSQDRRPLNSTSRSLSLTSRSLSLTSRSLSLSKDPDTRALRQAQGTEEAAQGTEKSAQGAAEPDLWHHGDAEVAEGLVDLAVNVRLPRPPRWLADVIADSIDDLAAYPNTDAAVTALAERHRVQPAQVLPLAGGAEGFTLLARARRWNRPVIIHPQFTEPEAALITAGYAPERVVLDAARGFVLDPDRVPVDADLVIIGNPTNPTGVLHPISQLVRLRRPGRTVCVDEAFMDAVPGETESLIGGDLDGVLVLRSLTKTWGLAGLRAGYAIGEAGVIADLRRQQPAWSVSGPALAVIAATASSTARAEAAAAAVEFTRRRELLTEIVTGVGLRVSPGGRAPFLLVDTRSWEWSPDQVRTTLREQGFVVRRGDSFPGLDGQWIRLAIRDAETSRALGKALQAMRPEDPR